MQPKSETHPMSEAGTAVRNVPAAEAAARVPDAQGRIAELKVSGHLMTLDTGVFCVFQGPGSSAPNDRSGLPGVRISLPPGDAGRPDEISISTFRDDGWMSGSDTAALIRVAQGPAQVLVTVYQAPSAPPETAPRLQVMRLGAEPGAGAQGAAVAATRQPAVPPEDADILAHVQRAGDVPSRIGDWSGTRGSRQWIEGFSLTPRDDLKPADVEYQAVLGRGWLSPWIEGGKFCGSRGMALPLLGLKVRLKGNAAKTHECSYSATFVDGSQVGPVAGGEACEAESLAALEAFQVVIRERGGAAAARGTRARGTGPTAPAADKPAAGKKAAADKPGARPAKPTGSGRRSR
jgi:Clostridial hydrophobic W